MSPRDSYEVNELMSFCSCKVLRATAGSVNGLISRAIHLAEMKQIRQAVLQS